ncbi:MAG: iron hydrogenase small subunit, partial [Peptococcaceae bacterium]|nr:iron hydrogenase small subunit [Peptococcaceae bacterium]
ARKLCEEVKNGTCDFHFMEVMACPGGCISGGGQPRTSVPPQDWVRQARIDTNYAKDASYELRNSHDNPEIKDLYSNFIGEPLSHLAHDLLHTHYYSRGDKLTRKEIKPEDLI